MEHQCNFNRSAVAAKSTGYRVIKSGSEEDLMKAVATVGPISVTVARWEPYNVQQAFKNYKSGEFCRSKLTIQ